jgi:dTDP-4-amino-4,6-dideoxygalactose transaminase
MVGTELDYVKQAVDNLHLAGGGTFTERCQDFLEAQLGVPRVLLTSSGTDGLEAAGLLLGLGPEDEFILPSFTFVSTANAFALRGARPVFVDIRPDTLNLDEARLSARLSDRTRAIVVVHYAGIACEMDAILAMAREADIPVIEDNAHGLFGAWRGRPLGSFGALSALSFHETKNVTCGEGGALVVGDESLVARAEVVVEKGTDRARFFRGQVDKYTWVELGSSFLPSELAAAYLWAQLEAADRIQERRRGLWLRYRERLLGWSEKHDVVLPHVPSGCRNPYHLFYLLLPSEVDRKSLIAHLARSGVESVFHYVPLHLSAMGRSYGYAPGDYPVTEEVSERLLRLPFFNDLTDAQQDRVIEALECWRGP